MKRGNPYHDERGRFCSPGKCYNASRDENVQRAAENIADEMAERALDEEMNDGEWLEYDPESGRESWELQNDRLEDLKAEKYEEAYNLAKEVYQECNNRMNERVSEMSAEQLQDFFTEKNDDIFFEVQDEVNESFGNDDDVCRVSQDAMEDYSYEVAEYKYRRRIVRTRSKKELKKLATREEMEKVGMHTANERIKALQFKALQKANPMTDDIHTGIRSPEDVKTYREAVRDDGLDDDFAPDYTRNDVLNARETGRITIYSSKPIKTGVFVTPSKMEAESYAGGGEVHSMEVDLYDVAWIDGIEGQYAKNF